MATRTLAPLLTCLAPEACPIALACAPRKTAPCAEVQLCHAAKLTLCAALERLADSLPGRIDRHACLRIAEALVPLLRKAQVFEEEFVFPAFASSVARRRSVRRLRAEHVEDEAAAEELTEMLLHVGHGGGVDNPEAFGFMLRAFFEGMRRHIAFEREHVVPLVVVRPRR